MKQSQYSSIHFKYCIRCRHCDLSTQTHTIGFVYFRPGNVRFRTANVQRHSGQPGPTRHSDPGPERDGVEESWTTKLEIKHNYTSYCPYIFKRIFHQTTQFRKPRHKELIQFSIQPNWISFTALFK